MRRRLLAFTLLALTSVAVPVVYVLRARRTASEGPAAPARPPAPPPGALEAPGMPRPPVAFRYTGPGDAYGRLVTADLGAPARDETVTVLQCDRLDVAAGHGVCLAARRGVFTTYEAILFDAGFRARHTLPLSGVPSRTRVSPDGRLAAMTVFESGHSYAAGQFSTRTTIVDFETGDVVVSDLERFTVLRDGQPIQSVDFNFWGVTFTRDGARFYATLGTGGRQYLIEGDMRARQARIIRADVECPSLSPDDTRIAFKRREGGGLTPITWRLSVLRLDTLEDWPLAERRSVDDQVAWLDESAVLYALPAAATGTAATDTWAVPADGSGGPRLVMPNAYSLVVVRDAAPSPPRAAR
jgi:WD40-like Beta Propeller Repeat